jgi:hypothetical protein
MSTVGGLMEAEHTEQGNTAGLGSTYEICVQKSKGRAVGRFALQNAARRLLPESRVALCCRRMTASYVQVLFDAEHGAAHYGGLLRCGCVWTCAVCASKVTSRRAEELRDALARHPELKPVMVTITLQHRRGDGLAGLLKALKEGAGVAGGITATEVTVSYRAGWHPHEHILFLCLGDVDVEGLRAFIADRFGAYLQREGRYVSAEYGVQAVAGDAAAASYLSKWDTAAELTKGNVKAVRSDGGMSPMMLLARAGDGDEAAGKLFQEYATAMHGKRLLVYTKGLRELLGMNEDKTDEEVAKQEVEPAVLLAALTVHQWRVVLANDARGELLDVAAGGDAAALWAWLSRLWPDDEGAR